MTAVGYASTSVSEEKHNEHEEKSHDEHADHGEEEHANEDQHEDEHAGHDDHDDHGEEKESSSSVGPEKGITAKGENGFKLSTEAIKTMEIQLKSVGSSSLLSIDKNTLVLVKDEKSVFRMREGWIKRVPVKILNKSNGIYSITSEAIQTGDQIVVHGTGYLRIAEVFAAEGASHGHSH